MREIGVEDAEDVGVGRWRGGVVDDNLSAAAKCCDDNLSAAAKQHFLANAGSHAANTWQAVRGEGVLEGKQNSEGVSLGVWSQREGEASP